MMLTRLAGRVGKACVPHAASTRLIAAQTIGKSLNLQSRGRKSEYIAFIKAATSDTKSPEHLQLNNFLTRCFVDADTDCDGKVHWPTFNFLIDMAVTDPRHYGIIQSRAERYASVEEMNENRRKMFQDIDRRNHGYLRLHDWLEFYHSYFGNKIRDFDPETSKSKINVSKDAFSDFLLKACSDRRNPEYKELYRFHLYIFQEGSVDGGVCAEGFDKMVDELAASPVRKFGFAPAAAEMFKTDADRIAARTELFKAINTTGTGRISFDQWLEYSYAHICGKAKLLHPSLTGVPPPTVREGSR